ncbi:hypothetical protein QCA50_000177 [Cerrena zonata]|uniref:Uncharacterized protein n=1 Tax=Cerrena zonata TaxID=2478898 RepID=A0AAW0GPY0_9APHY
MIWLFSFVFAFALLVIWTTCLPQWNINDGELVDEPDPLSSVLVSPFETPSDDGDDSDTDDSDLDDSEAEDNDGVIVGCANCSDCVTKRRVRRRNYKARKYVYGQGTVALANPGEDIPQYSEPGPSSYPKCDQPSYSMPIGQGPYQPWPLPIGQELSNRNSFQGQNPTTDNVVKPTTHAIHGPMDEKMADEVNPPLSPPKLTGTEPDLQQTSGFGTLTSDHDSEAAAMNVKTMKNT